MKVVSFMNSPQGRARRASARVSRPGRLPGWGTVLVVIAHPDDESFGLGAIISQMTTAGAAAHILCYTHGEASTLNQNGADLDREREAELRHASTELGAASLTLLDYPDGGLAADPQPELAAHALRLAARHRPDGLLVFDATGITGHPDHRAATGAAVAAATAAGLPVLAWALPAAVAGRLRAETGQPFAGQPPGRLDLCIRVDRGRQRRAALAHASQISPAAVIWRRLQLQGDTEHLRWLLPPRASADAGKSTPVYRPRRRIGVGGGRAPGGPRAARNEVPIHLARPESLSRSAARATGI
jgi:N-acetylglucosamine malate deacetylase 2